MGVGWPAIVYLQDFGEHVFRAFGAVPYHVGSSLAHKDGWRDVDVRLILADEDYAAHDFGDPARAHDNAKWVSICLAWSAFGKALTGLPIDFQIQQRSHANATNDGPRSGLFSVTEAYRRQRAIDGAIERFKRDQTCQTCGTAADQPNERCADHRAADADGP